MYKSILIFVTVLFIVACNSGSETESNKYDGFWKLDDTYLEITNLGEIIIYDCTLSDGYTRTIGDFARVVGNEMIINGRDVKDSYQLSISDGRVIGTDDELKFVLEPAELPTLCEDGVEIVYNYPQEAIEDELTTFTVDFDYRLSTDSEAVVRIAVRSAEYGLIFSDDQYIEIQKNDLGRGSFTVEATPFISNDREEPFALYIFLFITPELESQNSIKFIRNKHTSVPIHVWEETNIK
ncbi:hypothetical protein CW745_12415 [Psychromonas sp. psych-6C06]|nr:hypothetical protein CW745_12415 [Psychromonas sp. psych-6C06]